LDRFVHKLTQFCLSFFFCATIIAFGSTHTVNPVSAKTGFCDDWDVERWDEEVKPKVESTKEGDDHRLACLDDIMNDIELSSVTRDPWKDFPALRSLLRDRVDWDSQRPMISVDVDQCQAKNKPPCIRTERIAVGPKQVQSGEVFDIFSDLWKEENKPLIVKREQLQQSFWATKVNNILNRTWA
jgi:hypothetical protein